MRRAWITVFVALVMSFPAVSATFTLGAYISPTGVPAQDAPFPYAGMVTWTSPGTGSINITGDAWTTQSTDPIAVQYIPASLESNYTPGKKLVADLNPDTVLQAGTTPVLGGTVQYPYVTPGSPAAFATSPSIPCGIGLTWCSGYLSPLNTIDVEKGDVIAVLIENFNLYHGDTAGVDLTVQFKGDLLQQGPPGTVAAPELIAGVYTGIDGSLKPSSGHSSDAFEFYWPTDGDFSGVAATDLVFQNGVGGFLGTGGFLNGMELDLYNPSGSLISSATVLASSGTSDSFDLGYLTHGNYVLQVVDKNSGDDPPYSLQFNGSIEAPVSGNVPEPGTILLLCTGLAGLAVRRWIGPSAAGATPTCTCRR